MRKEGSKFELRLVQNPVRFRQYYNYDTISEILYFFLLFCLTLIRFGANCFTVKGRWDLLLGGLRKIENVNQQNVKIPMKTPKIIKNSLLFGMFFALVFSPANAATIISDSFSIAQGFAQNGALNSGLYDTSETAGVNVSPGANFTLSVSINAGTLSATGFTFVNGVLANLGGTNYSSYVDPGLVGAFLVTLDADYTGPTPGDAAPIPNYKLQLNITNVSLWAAGFEAQGLSGTLGWTETTAGNAQAQTPVSIETNPGANWLTLANYNNVAWTPTGFESTGTNQARTFGQAQTGAGFAEDGFLVTGNIVLTYDAVPEPSTAGLIFLAVGVGGFSFLRRQAVRVS